MLKYILGEDTNKELSLGCWWLNSIVDKTASKNSQLSLEGFLQDWLMCSYGKNNTARLHIQQSLKCGFRLRCAIVNFMVYPTPHLLS